MLSSCKPCTEQRHEECPNPVDCFCQHKKTIRLQMPDGSIAIAPATDIWLAQAKDQGITLDTSQAIVPTASMPTEPATLAQEKESKDETREL